MSVPFSNTHLRVPRGFGTILEGLAREVLRDQPEDIPKYAAKYFDTLLKQRQDSGVDPAEWAAKLEDRFYNNHAFKATMQFNPGKEAGTDVTMSKEKSYESQTEDESSHSAEISHLSTIKPHASEEVGSTENTGEEEEEDEEQHGITEEHISTEKGLSEEYFSRHSDADKQIDEPRDTEEEQGPATTMFDQVVKPANGNNSSSVPDQDIPQSKLEPSDLSSSRFFSDIDVCAQELGTGYKDEVGDKEETVVVDKEVIDSDAEERTGAQGSEEDLPYSVLAATNAISAQLVEKESAVEEATAEDVEDSSNPQPVENILLPLSESETPEDTPQEADDQAETTKEKKEKQISSGEVHEHLTDIDGVLDSNATPKEDSLVEISFEDVPEVQQIKEFREKQPEEEDSSEDLHTNIMEVQPKEESKEVAAVASGQNISVTQDQDKYEMVGVEKEVNPEGEEMESPHEASAMKEKVDANDLSLKYEDDKKGEDGKTINASHQPTSTADEEDPEYKTDHINRNTGKISEGKSQENDSNDPDFKDETTDIRKDKEDTYTEGCCEVEDQEISDVAEKNHSKVTQSNSPTAAMEAESETLEEQHLAVEDEESQRALAETQPEDTGVVKEVTSKEKTSEAEGLEEEGETVTQEKSNVTFDDGSMSPNQNADHPAADHLGEERPFGSEKDSTEPEGSSGDKQEECNRPQEEEDIMDIPLDDPEANRAAAKIQAGFRGHMTRKKMKPEDKAEGEEVSSTGDVLNGSQGAAETGGSGPVERDNTSVPEQ